MVEYAGIHLLDNPFFLDNAYDYFIPPYLLGQVAVGDFVTVPFGHANRHALGLVVTLKDEPENPTLTHKPVFSVCDRSMSLSDEMLGLCFFIKEISLCSIGDAVRAMIPSSALSRLRVGYRLTDLGKEEIAKNGESECASLLDYLDGKAQVPLETLRRRFESQTDATVTRLCERGLVEKIVTLRVSSEKNERRYTCALSRKDLLAIIDGNHSTIKLRSKAHTEILRFLAEEENPDEEYTEKEIAEVCSVTSASIRSLCEKGILVAHARKIDRSLAPLLEQKADPRPLVLNEEQSAALDTLRSLLDTNEARAALLHGVTGSGKTSVMLATVDHVLSLGKQAIVLLPEIALTPQTLAIFCSRYGDRVAIVHSGLSAGERFDTYHRIRSGGADVVVGTRSAVFAPLPALGMIVIDEEQEHTYKSDANPKYHARDIARYRCAHAGALMLLCSATPSFESYTKAREGKYTLIELKSRYGGAALPTTILVDMRREAGGGATSPLSNLLCQRLCENLAAGNQSILFLNRRGYHNFLSCRSCGKPVQCPKCSVSMAYHTVGGYESGELHCHWCGYRAPVPRVCPDCGSEHLSRMGFGTQRIEQELSSLMPNARILRMDADTTTSRYAYEKILGKFRRHEADILLGTQMVTKGHDFPDVTLVGVLLADMSLYLDDYRAGERTFSMLTQVIGRAGRGQKAGEAIIQTSNPDSECIRLACAQDFPLFYENEIRLRRSLRFPPYCDLALLTLSCTDEVELCRSAKRLSEEFQALCQSEFSDLPIDAFGPFEAPVYRVENRYRYRMVVKCRLNRRSRALFASLLQKFSNGPRGLTLSVDFNPSGL